YVTLCGTHAVTEWVVTGQVHFFFYFSLFYCTVLYYTVLYCIESPLFHSIGFVSYYLVLFYGINKYLKDSRSIDSCSTH
ncbi:hypothetical protein J3Q64DRAFT_1718854, partial [Phycomyces blakesleeanus]